MVTRQTHDGDDDGDYLLKPTSSNAIKTKQNGNMMSSYMTVCQESKCIIHLLCQESSSE